MHRSKCSPRLWDYCLQYSSEIRSRTAYGKKNQKGRTGYEIITGNTPDISEWIQFEWYQPVWFIDEVASWSEEKKLWEGGLVYFTEWDKPCAIYYYASPVKWSPGLVCFSQLRKNYSAWNSKHLCNSWTKTSAQRLTESRALSWQGTGKELKRTLSLNTQITNPPTLSPQWTDHQFQVG